MSLEGILELDVEAAISEIPGVAPIEDIEDAWKWAGGRRFTFVIALDGKGGAFQVNAMDSYDEGLVGRLIGFARERGPNVESGVEKVLPGFSYPGYAFDVAVLAVPAVHQYSSSQNQDLIAVTAALFPAYRCEFSGFETEGEARERFSRMLRPLDFKRKPSPFLRISFDNPETGARSTNAGRGFTDFRVLENELMSLENVPGGHVEMENFQQHVWRVVWDGKWIVEGPGGRRALAREALISWVHELVYSGLGEQASG